MRTILSLLVAFSCLCMTADAAVVQVFFVGLDNGTQSEFDRENQADDHYYWENGDYSGLGTGGGVWTGGQEIWSDLGATQMGFERALTPGDPHTNVYFQLLGDEAGDHAKFTFIADMISLGGGSSHDLEYSMNGNVFKTLSNVTSNTFVTVAFSGADIDAASGSNVITVRRTGGGTTSPWIQFDYVSLSVVAVPEPGTLCVWAGLMGLGVCAAARKRRRTNR